MGDQVRGQTGDELHSGAERGPVDREGTRTKLIKTQYEFNSRPKSEPSQVCLAVEISREQ